MPLEQPENPLPPVSQIRGLSDLSKAPHEVPLSGCRRKWIKETDSAYVRLAKQGGQHDYKIHRGFKADDHHSNSYEARREPFDFDTKNVWQRHAEDKESAEKKKVKLPAISPKYPSRMLTDSTNKEFSGANKLSFPPMPAQRKSKIVNFSKLISSGYGTDWFQRCSGGEKSLQKYQKIVSTLKVENHLNHHLQAVSQNHHFRDVISNLKDCWGN